MEEEGWSEKESFQFLKFIFFKKLQNYFSPSLYQNVSITNFQNNILNSSSSIAQPFNPRSSMDNFRNSFKCKLN